MTNGAMQNEKGDADSPPSTGSNNDKAPSLYKTAGDTSTQETGDEGAATNDENPNINVASASAAAPERPEELPKEPQGTTATDTIPKGTPADKDIESEISRELEKLINQGSGAKKGVRNENEKLNKHWALELIGNFTQAELSSQLKIQVTVCLLLEGKDINIQRVLIKIKRLFSF